MIGCCCFFAILFSHKIEILFQFFDKIRKFAKNQKIREKSANSRKNQKIREKSENSRKIGKFLVFYTIWKCKSPEFSIIGRFAIKYRAICDKISRDL